MIISEAYISFFFFFFRQGQPNSSYTQINFVCINQICQSPKKQCSEWYPRNFLINPTARLTVLNLLRPRHWDPSLVMQVLHLSFNQLHNIPALRIYTETICHSVNAAEQLKRREISMRRSLSCVEQASCVGQW